MQSFVPREAFVWKIHRELCIPKCARKVSGLSRNGPQVSESLACSGWKRPSGPNLGEHRQGTTLWQHVQGYLNSPTFFFTFFFSFSRRMRTSSSSRFMQYRLSRPQCLRCFLLWCAKELWSRGWQYHRLSATTSGRSIFFKIREISNAGAWNFVP